MIGNSYMRLVSSMNGGPTFTNTKSVLFDGVDEYVDLGRVTMTESVSKLSVSCWVKVSTLASSSYFFGKYLNTANGIFGQTTTAGEVAFGVYNGAQTYVITTNTISINTWYNLTFVYDGTLSSANRLRIYIDGTLQATATSGGTMPSTTSSHTDNFEIGALSPASVYATASIEEFPMFDYSLSGAEVTALYNSGCPNDLMTLAAAKRPEHYYRMGDDALDVFPTIKDIGETAGNDGTMTNMESGDIQTDTPC